MKTRNYSRQWYEKCRKISVLALFLLCTAAPLLFIPPVGFAANFNFDSGNLEGWTMQGIGDSSTFTYHAPNPFTFYWDDATQYPGSLTTSAHSDPVNNLGSAAAKSTSLVLPAGFPSGATFWFIDLISPDLTADTAWQNITGLSLKLRGDNNVASHAQILLDVTRKSDGTKLNYMETSAAGDGVFHDILTDNNTLWYLPAVHWMNLYPHFGDLSNYTINNVQIRIFGYKSNAGSSKSDWVNIDNVVPITGASTIGVQGRATFGTLGECGNYVDIVYDSDIGPAPYLTKVRYDFTNTNVKINDFPAPCGHRVSPPTRFLYVSLQSNYRD